MKLMVKNVDEKTVRRLAHEYLSGYYVTLKTLGTRYHVSPNTISDILWRGIAENIIDLKLAKYIYTKIVDKPSIGWYQRKMRWDKAFEERSILIHKLKKENEKEQELIALKPIKEYYESLIEGYDKYTYEERGLPNLEELKAKLEKINDKIASLS